jgi:predicted dehydrogenase
MTTTPHSTVRYGFIGCGMMGHEHLRNLALIDGAQAHAIFEPDDGMAAQALALAPAAQRMPDLPALLARTDLDALVITSPNHVHAPQLVAIADSAPRAVLCEKPLVATAAQAERVVALARERGVFLMEAMWTRFLPLYGALRERLAGPDGIGEVCAVRASFGYAWDYEPEGRQWNPAAAGGALLDIGIYLFTLTRGALERQPGTGPEPLRSQVAGLQAPSGVDRRVWATLAFEGGAVAQLFCALDVEGENAGHLLGTRGSLTIENPFWGATRARLHRPHRPRHLRSRSDCQHARRRGLCRCQSRGTQKILARPSAHRSHCASYQCLQDQ